MSAYHATLRRITQIIRPGPSLGISLASDEFENYINSYEFQNIKLNPNLKRIYREFALGMAMLHHNIGKTTAKLHSVAADNIRLLSLNLQEQGLLNPMLVNLRTQPQARHPVSSRCLDLYEDEAISSGIIGLPQGSQLKCSHVWFKPDARHFSSAQTLQSKPVCNLFLVLEGIVAVKRNSQSWQQHTGAGEQIVKRGGVISQDLDTDGQTLNVISEQTSLLYVHVNAREL